jgi:hypothetical protein
VRPVVVRKVVKRGIHQASHGRQPGYRNLSGGQKTQIAHLRSGALFIRMTRLLP